MIEKIKKLLYLFFNAKLEFSNPPQKKILIFDDTSIEDFKYILLKRKYFILSTRVSNIKKVYISLKIVFFLLKYLNYNLYTSYLIALIKVIKPKKSYDCLKAFKLNNYSGLFLFLSIFLLSS